MGKKITLFANELGLSWFLLQLEKVGFGGGSGEAIKSSALPSPQVPAIL